MCKLSIFKGEARRHLVNCSTEQEYGDRIAQLRYALLSRGYPESALQSIPYSREKRDAVLRQLHARNFGVARDPKSVT